MTKTTKSVLFAFCLALTVVCFGGGSAAAQGPEKGGKGATAAAQPHWCRRLARKCKEGNDDACVAWGDYCADRVRNVKAKLWAPEKEAPPEVKALLGDEPQEAAAKPPTENEMNMTVGCRRLHSLCKGGNHTACRVFATKCVETD